MAYRVNAGHSILHTGGEEGEGTYHYPGDVVDLSHLDEANIKKLVDGGVVTAVEVAEPTEAARELAEETGVPLAQIKGTGKGGRVTKADVAEAAGTVKEE